VGPCLTAAAPKAAPEVSFATKPLRRCPNACCGGQRGLLSRWVHADLRETWRRVGFDRCQIGRVVRFSPAVKIKEPLTHVMTFEFLEIELANC
jgi:hypothetical protein